MTIARRVGQWPHRHTRVVILALSAAFAGGAAFAVRLPIDRAPPVSGVVLQVRAELPGFDVATVQAAVTEPLEQAFSTVGAVKAVESRSRNGQADVYLNFAAAAGRSGATDAVRRRIAASIARLPAGIATPVLVPVERSRPAIVFAVPAAKLTEETARWVRNIFLDPLRELPQVAAVTLEGLEEHEILVVPEPRRLAALGLDFDALIAAVRRSDDAPGHAIGRHVVLAPDSPDAIAARTVQLGGGESISLGEIARVSVVRQTTVEPPRYDGVPALRLTVHARHPRDAARVAERANAHLAWLRANDVVPPDIVAHAVHDEAHATRAWRKQLIQRAASVIGVIVVSVFLFYGPRSSAVTAGAFAVWLAASLAGLWYFGFALDWTVAAAMLLAAVPFSATMTSRFSPFGLLWVALTVAAPLAAGALLGLPAPKWTAVLLLVLAGILIRWLMTPWIVPPAVRRAPMARAWPGLPTGAAPVTVSVLALLAALAAARTPPGEDVEAGDDGIRVRVMGADPARLDAMAASLLSALHAIPGADDITSTAVRDETWRLHLDPARMAAAGVEFAAVGRALAIANQGLVVGEIVSAERRLPLRLLLVPGAAGESFEQLPLRGERDKRRAVYLRDIGFVERVIEPRERLRVNGKPVVELTARWNGEAAREALERFCGEIEVPEGYSVDCAFRRLPGR